MTNMQVCHWLWSMTNMQFKESNSYSVFMHICHWLWSMTNMQVKESNSLSVFYAYLSLIMVTDKYAGYWVQITLIVQSIFVIDCGQWQICRLLSLNHTQCPWHICHWLWSMINMQVIESKSHSMVNVNYAFSQWHKYFETFYDLHPLRSGQWQICI